MPTAEIQNDLKIPSPARRKQGLSRALNQLLSISLAGIFALLLGGVVYQFYETDSALIWNPNILAATAYIWPLVLLLSLYCGVFTRFFGCVHRLSLRLTLAILALVFTPALAAIFYVGGRVLGLTGFELFAGIGAILVVYPLLRFAAGRGALGHILVLALPGVLLGTLGVLSLERRYLLIASMGEQFMDPNAQLLLVLTSLCLFCGVALIPYLAGGVLRHAMHAHGRVVGIIAAGLLAGAIALIWLNRAVLVPRLYLETHLLLAFFEWILLVGAAGWFGVLRPPVYASDEPKISRKLGVIAALILASHAFLLFVPPAPGQPVAPRSDYLAGVFVQPYRWLFDADRDGYLPRYLGGIDCDDTRAEVNPLARERRGNGIDDNCIRGDAPAGKTAEPTLAHSDPSQTSNARLVIVISIDMLRPDFMQVYGAEDATTPYLHAHQHEWTRFEHAYTAGGITTLALPSLLRGRIPLAIDFEPAYRTLDMRYVFAQQSGATNRVFASPRADRHPTIGHIFQQAGRPTRAIVDDGPAGIFQKGFGFEQGFDTFHYPNLPEGPGPEAWNLDALTDTAVSLIEADQAEGFWWLHIYDPHAAHPPCRDFAATPGLGCYRDAIRDADQAIARIAEALRAANLWDTTALFITSDHGEALGEHGLSHHGLDSYEEFVRIPLLVKYPASRTTKTRPKGEVVSRPVSLIDVSTTALALAGLQPPASFQGEDLRQISAGSERRLPVISQLLITDTKGVPYRQQTLLVEDTHRLMVDRITQKTWLFDLAGDPGQKAPLMINGAGDPAALAKAAKHRESLEAALETMEAAGPGSRDRKFP